MATHEGKSPISTHSCLLREMESEVCVLCCIFTNWMVHKGLNVGKDLICFTLS